MYDARDAYEDLGQELENAIRSKILSNVPPPLKEATIKRKGSSHTLIDTGQMLADVSHQVDDSDPTLIKITAGIFDEDIAEYAVSHEYGREEAGIPKRSFIRSTYEEVFDTELMEKFSDNIQDLAIKKLGK
jgi:hypothetical protein